MNQPNQVPPTEGALIADNGSVEYPGFVKPGEIISVLVDMDYVVPVTGIKTNDGSVEIHTLKVREANDKTRILDSQPIFDWTSYSATLEDGKVRLKFTVPDNQDQIVIKQTVYWSLTRARDTPSQDPTAYFDERTKPDLMLTVNIDRS